MTKGFSGAAARSGFSLVELSIVLVILGLLTGGILTGQNLIRAAELRGIVTDYQKLISSIKTFQNKYMALPGDMPNATEFWGLADASDCENTASTGTETCDGNGNGVISSADDSNERHRFWQHLANAGLLEGTYTGVVGSGTEAGVNVFSGRISNTWWYTSSCCSGGGTSFYQPNGYGRNLRHSANGWTSFLTPEETWGIDKKVDDGRPAYGKAVAGQWEDCTTATAWNDIDSEYNLQNTSKDCNIFFPHAF